MIGSTATPPAPSATTVSVGGTRLLVTSVSTDHVTPIVRVVLKNVGTVAVAVDVTIHPDVYSMRLNGAPLPNVAGCVGMIQGSAALSGPNRRSSPYVTIAPSQSQTFERPLCRDERRDPGDYAGPLSVSIAPSTPASPSVSVRMTWHLLLAAP